MRANPLKGEALLGDRLLRVDFDAWCAFETASGKKLPDLMYEMQQGLGVNDVVQWVGAFLAEPADDAAVRQLIRDNGYPAALEALGAAIEGFFPPPKEKGKNPPKAE
jgi:hypothetical protein